MLLKCHKQFEGVVKKMGKTGMMKGGDAGMAKQMQRNPTQCMQQLQKVMDPRMLQQVRLASCYFVVGYFYRCMNIFSREI